MGKYLIKQTKTGIKFDLKAGNGEVVATSEVYTTEKACRAGIESVRKNAPVAAVENQTAEGFAKEKHPKFEVYNDKAGEFRFRLKAKNGQIIATSEGYKAKKSCMNGIASVRKNAPDAKIVAGMAETAPKPPFSTVVGPATKARFREETGVRKVLFSLS